MGAVGGLFGGSTTVSVKEALDDLAEPSDTSTTIVWVATCVLRGVPLKVRVVALKVSQSGRGFMAWPRAAL